MHSVPKRNAPILKRLMRSRKKDWGSIVGKPGTRVAMAKDNNIKSSRKRVFVKGRGENS